MRVAMGNSRSAELQCSALLTLQIEECAANRRQVGSITVGAFAFHKKKHNGIGLGLFSHHVIVGIKRTFHLEILHSSEFLYTS